MHAVHSGEAAGLAGRLLVLVSGLGAASLFVTGVIRFRHKRRARVLAGRNGAGRGGRTPARTLRPRNDPARAAAQPGTAKQETAMTKLFERLVRRARRLDADIRAEEARRAPDSLRVMELKRRKLATRDELARLEAGLLTGA
jgi:hypothetical protein